MKGILLAGGSGTRLRPITTAVSKQLLPVFDKPLVYYPLSVLMLAGIRDILVVTTPSDSEQFGRLLGDGSQWGIELTYAVQPSPGGVAQALLIAQDHVAGDSCALVLGDNLFYSHGFSALLEQSVREVETGGGCRLFGYQVSDPERYGVAVYDPDGEVVDIEEKPAKPQSRTAITGLYMYDSQAVPYARELTPSDRGELEITDLNRRYLRAGRARLLDLGRGAAWLDTGTHESLLEAAQFVEVLQRRQGITIACLEEVALLQGFIDADTVLDAGARMGDSHYAAYLRRTALDHLDRRAAG